MRVEGMGRYIPLRWLIFWAVQNHMNKQNIDIDDVLVVMPASEYYEPILGAANFGPGIIRISQAQLSSIKMLYYSYCKSVISFLLAVDQPTFLCATELPGIWPRPLLSIHQATDCW